MQALVEVRRRVPHLLPASCSARRKDVQAESRILQTWIEIRVNVFIVLSTIRYPLSTILYPLSIINYPLLLQEWFYCNFSAAEL